MIYVTSAAKANEYLKHVIEGAAGFDTEGTQKTHTYVEKLIIGPKSAPSREGQSFSDIKS